MTNRHSPALNSRNRGERAVLAVLPPSVNISESTSDKDGDLIVNGHALTAKWVGQGRLSDVRTTVHDRHERNVILVARHMSP